MVNHHIININRGRDLVIFEGQRREGKSDDTVAVELSYHHSQRRHLSQEIRSSKRRRH